MTADLHALTESERGQYHCLLEGGEGEPALLRCELDGRDVAVAALVEQNGENFLVVPLAILVDDELRARLTCEGQPLTEENPA